MVFVTGTTLIEDFSKTVVDVMGSVVTDVSVRVFVIAVVNSLVFVSDSTLVISFVFVFSVSLV